MLGRLCLTRKAAFCLIIAILISIVLVTLTNLPSCEHVEAISARAIAARQNMRRYIYKRISDFSAGLNKINRRVALIRALIG